MTSKAFATKTEGEAHDLGPVERIPLGEGRCYRVAGHEVAVFRTRTGELFAGQADCPHRGGPLADGLTGAHQVICPLHGHTFDLSTGEPVNNACTALRMYPVEVTSGGSIRIIMPWTRSSPPTAGPIRSGEPASEFSKAGCLSSSPT